MARLCPSPSGSAPGTRASERTTGTDLGLLAPAPLLRSGNQSDWTVIPGVPVDGTRAVRRYRLALWAYQRKPAARDADARGH